MKRFIAFFVVIVLVSIPAAAQEVKPKPANAGKIENIRYLLKLTKSEDVQQVMVNQILTALKPMLSAAPGGDAQAQKIYSRFSDVMMEEFRKIDFLGMTVSLYDKYFTNDEIVALIRFYETPAGQKATQVLPSLVQESMAHGQEQGQRATAKAMARVAEEFPQLRDALQRAQ